MKRSEFIVKEILQKVIELRRKCGHTQQFVANKLGYTQGMYSQIESGGRNPNTLTLEYFRSIGIPITDLDILTNTDKLHPFIAGFERGLKGQLVDNQVLKELFVDYLNTNNIGFKHVKGE